METNNTIETTGAAVIEITPAVNNQVNDTTVNQSVPVQPVVEQTVNVTPTVVVDTKTVSTNKNPNSLKGKWGKIGAPPKQTNWPTTPFTLKDLNILNPNQDMITLRKKVNELLSDNGKLIELASVKQPGGNVGRPQRKYVLKEFFNTETMPLVQKKVIPTQPVVEQQTTPTTTVTEQQPIVEQPAIEQPVTMTIPVIDVVENETNQPIATEPVTEMVGQPLTNVAP